MACFGFGNFDFHTANGVYRNFDRLSGLSNKSTQVIALAITALLHNFRHDTEGNFISPNRLNVKASRGFQYI
ncbi:hypothetical protein D3C83_210350 [compost metagenome]